VIEIIDEDPLRRSVAFESGNEAADLWNDNDGKRSIVFEFHGDQVEILTDEYKRGKAEAT